MNASDPVAADVELPEKAGSMDAVLPWLISLTFHFGLGLILAFIIYLTFGSGLGKENETIIVPNSFEDPAYSEHPGGIPNPGSGGDPTREAAQDKLKELAKSEGWAENPMQSVSSLLQGSSGNNEAVGIFAGSGASLGAGKGSGAGESSTVAAYGSPGGGAGNGPRSSFYGTGGNATQIVYLIDHTGSLVESFGPEAGSIKGEVGRSISALVPLQYFSIVVFTSPSWGGVQVISSPMRASVDNKSAALQKLRAVVAEGGENDAETIFIKGFQTAFAQHPQLIYFLTDGDVTTNVTAELRKLNKDKKVKINVVMFTPFSATDLSAEDKRRFEVMDEMAKENGGVVKVISSR